MNDTFVVVELDPPITVTVGGQTEVVVVKEPQEVTVVYAGTGGGGASVDPNMFFQTLLRFAELDTEQKKVEARVNLDLQIIDLGTFN